MRWWVRHFNHCQIKLSSGRWACIEATNDDPIYELDVQLATTVTLWTSSASINFTFCHSRFACYRSMLVDTFQLNSCLWWVCKLCERLPAPFTHASQRRSKSSNFTDNCSRYTTLEMISFNSIGLWWSTVGAGRVSRRSSQWREDGMRTMWWRPTQNESTS